MDSKKQYMPVRLHYQLYVPNSHDPELSPIILLHGVAATHSSWSRVINQIGNKTKRKIYAVDLRNHGESEWSDHNSMHDYQADLENFLRENDIKKCILIGHSMGGKIAMFFALRKPHFIEKIITEEVWLSNPGEEDITSFQEILGSAKLIKKLPKTLQEKDIRDLLANIIEEKYPHHRDISFCTPLKRNSQGSFEFYFNIEVIEKTFKNRTAFDIDFEECKKFTGQTLFLYGGTLATKVETDEKIKEFFPNAEFRKSLTSSHVLHAERPSEFITAVSNFINKELCT